MKTTYQPTGVCSRQFELELEDGVIKSLNIKGGCNGNLKGISTLLNGKKAEEIISLFRGIKCGAKPTSCPDQISFALEEALKAEAAQKEAAQKSYSSGIEFDMEKEYIYQQYPHLRRENSPAYGAAGPEEVVIRPVYFDELCYLLSTEGAHLVLFGGPWSAATNSIIDQINFYARKYGVDAVYTFDFRADGATPETDIKQDITAQASYEGPGKKAPNPAADCNYIYGELVTRHLTNLNDWVRRKVGTEGDITYLNLYQDAVTVPNLQEPFLFLFNKDNKIDHSGAVRGDGYVNEAGTYPIVYAMELEAYRDGNDGRLYSDPAEHNESTRADNFGELLENGIFKHIGEEGVVLTPYTHADYMRDSFSMNERGHSFKTEDAFKKDEQINIQMTTLPELLWILQQKGSYIILFGGPWCACTQSAVATVNDYAVANNVRVYMFDMRLDGKHPIDFWKYPRLNELKLTAPMLRRYYVEVWEKYLPGAPILCSIEPETKSWGRTVTLSYTDEGGAEHEVLSVGVPYLLAYNKDNTIKRGRKRPVLASRHDAGELINCSEDFIYYEPNYRNYKAGVYFVFHTYADSLGQTVKDITIDRTAPRVEGQPVRHVETVAYHKEHDWNKERAGRAQPEEDPYDCCCC